MKITVHRLAHAQRRESQRAETRTGPPHSTEGGVDGTNSHPPWWGEGDGCTALRTSVRMDSEAADGIACEHLGPGD